MVSSTVSHPLILWWQHNPWSYVNCSASPVIVTLIVQSYAEFAQQSVGVAAPPCNPSLPSFHISTRCWSTVSSEPAID